MRTCSENREVQLPVQISAGPKTRTKTTHASMLGKAARRRAEVTRALQDGGGVDG